LCYCRDEVAQKLANKTQINVDQRLKDEIDDLRDKWAEVSFECKITFCELRLTCLDFNLGRHNFV